MRPLGPREVVPVPVQQLGKNLRLHLAGRLGRIALRVAFVALRAISKRNRRTVRIHRRREHHKVLVGRPARVVRLAGNRRQPLCVGRCAQRRVKIRGPNLRPALAPAHKQNPLVVRRKLHATVARLRHRNLRRLSARNLLDPPLRGSGIFVQIHGGNRICQPHAVRGNRGLAQPLHGHHVLKGHGPLLRIGLRGRKGRHRQNSSKNPG